jgi:hypothetical protein
VDKRNEGVQAKDEEDEAEQDSRHDNKDFHLILSPRLDEI